MCSVETENCNTFMFNWFSKRIAVLFSKRERIDELECIKCNEQILPTFIVFWQKYEVTCLMANNDISDIFCCNHQKVEDTVFYIWFNPLLKICLLNCLSLTKTNKKTK